VSFPLEVELQLDAVGQKTAVREMGARSPASRNLAFGATYPHQDAQLKKIGWQKRR
jgi:hypothetical protein